LIRLHLVAPFRQWLHRSTRRHLRSILQRRSDRLDSSSEGLWLRALELSPSTIIQGEAPASHLWPRRRTSSTLSLHLHHLRHQLLLLRVARLLQQRQTAVQGCARAPTGSRPGTSRPGMAPAAVEAAPHPPVRGKPERGGERVQEERVVDGGDAWQRRRSAAPAGTRPTATAVACPLAAAAGKGWGSGFHPNPHPSRAFRPWWPWQAGPASPAHQPAPFRPPSWT
jgi:hypothetical protein